MKKNINPIEAIVLSLTLIFLVPSTMARIKPNEVIIETQINDEDDVLTLADIQTSMSIVMASNICLGISVRYPDDIPSLKSLLEEYEEEEDYEKCITIRDLIKEKTCSSVS